MKTTIDLPDELFQKAKETALKRKTTLKQLLEHALRRELNPAAGGIGKGYRVEADGMPVLNQCREQVTSEAVYRLRDQTEGFEEKG